MPLSNPPGEVERGTKELRLAVVCYGGVSLAVYMHGVTKELQSLFRASQAYRESQSEEVPKPPRERNPFGPAQTEFAYWEALRQAHEGEDAPATRVVVDIVSGTSAGGINGIILAKALARGQSSRRLRDVWLDEGNIFKLMSPFAGGDGGIVDRLKSAWTAARNAPRGPLNGNFLLDEVYKALEEMDKGGEEAGPGSGKCPWPVELHVTLTDLLGFPQAAPAWDPKAVKDRRHRYVLGFRSPGRLPERPDPWPPGQFERDDNRALAFAARATSSFPGAFPPTRISDVEAVSGAWEDLDEFLREYWEIYALSDVNPRETAFIDGGVLDNAPFDLAIKGIEERPATSEVDRKLLFIQPDPVDPSGGHQELPGWRKIVWQGVAGIPRREPILNDLLRIRARNERVRRVAAVVAATEEYANRLPEAPELEELVDAEDEVRALMAGQEMAQATYLQLKLHAVVDRLAEVVCELRGFPPESDYAFFVSDVLARWASDRDLLTYSQDAWEGKQLPFLRAFDLGYRERRVRFVIDRLNDLYEPLAVSRDALDKLKQALYQRVWVLTEVGRKARDTPAAGELAALFSNQRVAEHLAMGGTPEDSVKRFLDEHSGTLDRIHGDLEELLTAALRDFSKDTYEALFNGVARWPDDARTTLLRSYVAFPIYDSMLFPIRALSELGELDEVEVIRLSPLDARLVEVPGVDGPATVADKLEGDAAGHFAAFFSRRKRENDYLWGRLDAVERLLSIVLERGCSSAYKLGFRAVLDDEREALRKVDVDRLGAKVDELPEKLQPPAP